MRTGHNLQTGAEAVQGQQSHLPGQAVQPARLLLRPDLGQGEHGHNGSENVMSEQSINLTNDDMSNVIIFDLIKVIGRAFLV